ncbi:MAG: accessory Sec system translocase SecA2 [Pseudonocardiaceae bacterium]
MVFAAVRDGVRRFLQRPAAVDLRQFRPVVDGAGAWEQRYRRVTDAELAESVRAMFVAPAPARSHDRLAEFCAAGREAVRRALGQRLFDEQLLGVLGMVAGHVVDMATGEGKTLCGAIAAAGFAAQGRRVHVLSVNDYLAQRDCAWMHPVYALLGVSVDCVQQSHSARRRREGYAAQVVYGAVSEIGFDLLRDRLVTEVADRVGPELDVAIIDEIDSILIDEARVPLVLAGAMPDDGIDPVMMDVVRTLRPGRDYRVDAEQRNVALTDHGTTVVEDALGVLNLYTAAHATTLAGINVALHALVLLSRDVDYIVRDDVVQLINPSRGRVAALQRWPDGIQAAVEAKERVPPSPTGEVLDSITIGNLVRRFRLVAGMTGTAVAVADELREFHQLEVMVVPRHQPCVRIDIADQIFVTADQRRDAAVGRIRAIHATGRPILIGTQSVAASEELASALREQGLDPAVLNARNDAEEAAIIARAGEIGRITVSTQMAGRGTDIRLGGTGPDATHQQERVVQLGGLYVMGYGRHASSRLDDQLRGRAGRQGDPGSSEFFTSLDDEILTRHGVGIPTSVEDPRTTAAVDQAQRIAQADNRRIHSTTWNYHHLIDQQRDRVLNHREQILRTRAGSEDLARRCADRYSTLVATLGEVAVDQAGRQIWLYHLDLRWTQHLEFLAELREGIHLRGLARGLTGLSPLDEFHQEAMRAIRTFTADVERDTQATFSTTRLEDGVLELARVIKRPTSTWTYLVTDTPFGIDAERALNGLITLFTRRDVHSGGGG